MLLLFPMYVSIFCFYVYTILCFFCVYIFSLILYSLETIILYVHYIFLISHFFNSYLLIGIFIYTDFEVNCVQYLDIIFVVCNVFFGETCVLGAHKTC